MPYSYNKILNRGINSKISRLFIFINILCPCFALEELPSRPTSGIYDEADLFTSEEEVSLAVELRHALENHLLEVYVVTYQLVKGENMAERGARLRNRWARNPFALVLVYDETLGQISFVGSRDFENFVDKQQLAGAFQRAAETARKYLAEQAEAEAKPVPSVMIRRSVNALVRDPVLIERMTLPERKTFTKPMVILLGLFVLLMIAAGGLVWLLEKRLDRSKELSKRIDHFPVTHMPLRLGALYSGGKSATIGE
jgi:uncharacterized membrane protein YgcG